MTDEPLSPQDRHDLIEMVLNVFRHWQVPSTAHAVLLGLPQDTSARALLKIQQGSALPNEADLVIRAQLILKIYRGALTLFPGNPTMANYWVTTDSYQFNNRSPLEVMHDEGLAGMQSILDHINGDVW
jgi:hypothetical protein